jgi:hypothetical protein
MDVLARRAAAIGFALVSVLAFIAVAATASARADSFTWLGPSSLIATGGSHALPAVSCPTATQCTTADSRGEEITFNPSTGAILSRGSIDLIGTVSSISCSSVNQCVAVDNGGNEIPFNPSSGASIGAGFNNVDPDQLTSVFCVSGTACTAVDRDGREVSFNPNSDVVVGPTDIDSSTQLNGVACVPNTPGAQCTVVDTSGAEFTFSIRSNLSASNNTGVGVNSRALNSVSCPSSSVCSAVDSSGYEVSFDPATGTVTVPATQIDAPGGTGVALHSVSCPSASQCVAVDNLGNEVTYSPVAAPAPAIRSVDGATVINAVSCPAGGTSCGAVDNRSHGFAFTTAGVAGTAYTVVAPLIAGVACPLRQECTAIDSGSSEVTFDPTTGTINNAGVQPIDTSGNALTAISCLSGTECTAVDDGGFEVTFDPANGEEIADGFVSLESVPLDSVACQEVSSAAQCTAVDSAGNEVTFDPETSQIDPNTPIQVDPTNSALQSVSCPTGTQCTAVDSLGNEVTFNPVTGNHYTSEQAVHIDSGTGNDLLSVACPSSTQCTAVDQGGYVLTFTNAATAPPTDVPRQDLESRSTSTSLNSITCPSSAQCTTVDSMGEEATFNPITTTLNADLLTPVVGANALASVACQSTSICAAVDAEGNEFSGIEPPVAVGGALPTIPSAAQQSTQLTETNGSWTNDPTGYTYVWEDCTSATDASTCNPIGAPSAQTYTPVTTDVGFYIRVIETASNAGGPGAPAISAATALVTPSPATSTAPPTITSGSYYQQGTQLTEHNGTWTEADASATLNYSYQWEDCDATGAHCAAISSATSQTYTPTASDVGHTLVVTEVADNGGVPVPNPVASAPTAVIAPAPPANTAPPTIVGAAVQQGQTLTDRHGTWTNTSVPTTYTYQWEDCDASGANCTPIGGATAQTYTPSITDVGDTLVVLETATNGGQPAPGATASAPSAVVLPAPPSSISPPTIAGLIVQGQPLTEGHGVWSQGVDAPSSYSYQWADCNSSGADCAGISGATGTSYTPTVSDVGHTLVVFETASDAGGSAAATSAPTAVVAAAPAPAIQAQTEPAKPVGPNTATVQGQVNTQGLAVTWLFEYGTTTSYSSATPLESIAAGGPDTVSVNHALSGLKPSTKYHFRIVETVGATPYAPSTTAYGPDMTFTTSTAGKVALGSRTVHVSSKGVAKVSIDCKSTLTCVERFSIETSTQIDSGTVKHSGDLLCATALTTVKAGKTSTVSASLTKGCLALLKAAPGHKLVATFTTRPRTGQLGTIGKVTLVEGSPTTSKSHKAASARKR